MLKSKNYYLLLLIYFADNLYYRFNLQLNRVENGYPQPLSNWVGLPRRIDASLRHINKWTYIFSGNQYYRLSNSKMEVNISILRTSKHCILNNRFHHVVAKVSKYFWMTRLEVLIHYIGRSGKPSSFIYIKLWIFFCADRLWLSEIQQPVLAPLRKIPKPTRKNRTICGTSQLQFRTMIPVKSLIND